jgi:hypothetical protein
VKRIGMIWNPIRKTVPGIRNLAGTAPARFER